MLPYVLYSIGGQATLFIEQKSFLSSDVPQNKTKVSFLYCGRKKKDKQ